MLTVTKNTGIPFVIINTILEVAITDVVEFRELQVWNLQPAGIYLLEVNNRNIRARCEICSKLQRRRCSGVFFVNFEHISLLDLVFLMLTLNK